MPIENKKQLLVIGGAVLAGVMAVVLMSRYITNSIQGQTNALAEHFDVKQKQMVTEIQQRNDQQMAAVVAEMQRQKAEQAQEMQKEISSLQEQIKARPIAAPEQAGAPTKGHKPSLALKTPSGKRAVTVLIDSLEAVGGLLNPGDVVDVIAQLELPSKHKENAKTVTAMIFQNLQVLAIDTNLDQPGDYDRQQSIASLKVTFAVDPQQAGLLAFANTNGKLKLALRAPEENQILKVQASTWKTLANYVMKNQGYDIQNPDREKSLEPVQEKPTVEIFRGGKEL